MTDRPARTAGVPSIEQFRHAQHDCERDALARILDAMAAGLYADR
ncbi:MAG: hypothetical protein ACRDP8_10045 [Actinopolymorphaceae bacterium]